MIKNFAGLRFCLVSFCSFAFRFQDEKKPYAVFSCSTRASFLHWLLCVGRLLRCGAGDTAPRDFRAKPVPAAFYISVKQRRCMTRRAGGRTICAKLITAPFRPARKTPFQNGCRAYTARRGNEPRQEPENRTLRAMRRK